MANLLNKANNILNEKNSKIKPNNIKKGVQIFDVMGTLDAGGDDIYDYFSPDLQTDGGTSDILKNAIKKIPTKFSFEYGNLSYFLANCNNLIECPDFEIINGDVYAMEGVFQNCYNLESVPSINWSGMTKELSNGMGYAYQGCYKLKTINNVGTCYPSSTYGTFSGCSELVSINGTISLEICYSAGDMFSDCSKLEYSPVIDYSGLSEIMGMYRNCQSLKELNLITLKYNQVYNSVEFLDGVPDNCHIIVLDENMRQWLLGLYPNLTNVELASTHTITINSSDIDQSLTEGITGMKYTLTPISASKEIQSFDMNGETITGNTFIMPDADVVIDNVVFLKGYKITINSDDIIKNLDEGYPTKIYTLTPVDVNKLIVSFDVITVTQGTIHVEGNSFEMYDEDVILDNFIFMSAYATYESPHPYSDNMYVTHFDGYVDGAVYIRIVGQCNTEAGCDTLTVTYHDNQGEGVIDNYNQYNGDTSFDFIAPIDNYVKIEFNSDGSVSADYWGYRISIIRLDENYEPID